MEVGSFYGFRHIFKQPKTSLPHQKDDLVVMEKFKKGGYFDCKDNCTEKLYPMLDELSKNTVLDAFGIKNDFDLVIKANGKNFVYEG